jgi:ribosomal-protein-alanine N-acetyltransferase
MSALLNEVPAYRRMRSVDLDHVLEIEHTVYPFPWTRGNFHDSLAAGYRCWIMECGGAIVGYSIMATAAGEAHLLNLSIAENWQRRGLGRDLLSFVMRLATEDGAQRMLLEVRPSNVAALALYRSAGFRQIGRRRDYYPAEDGREDALVMELALP